MAATRTCRYKSSAHVFVHRLSVLTCSCIVGSAVLVICRIRRCWASILRSADCQEGQFSAGRRLTHPTAAFAAEGGRRHCVPPAVFYNRRFRYNHVGSAVLVVCPYSPMLGYHPAFGPLAKKASSPPAGGSHIQQLLLRQRVVVDIACLPRFLYNRRFSGSFC